ncbi:hypothetical protein D3C72_1785610 [compost metagenome]
MAGGDGFARRGLQGGGAVAQPGLALSGQRLLEGLAEILVAGVADRARQPQHGGGRHAQRLRLPPHRPQPDFSRMRHHPMRRAL